MSRSKVLGIESLTVMIVLILFAFVVFMVIDSGANAYNNIVDDKQATTGARVAYSYISMKVKQNDALDSVHVIDCEYGDALCIGMGDKGFSTFIFYADGNLYECIAKSDASPSVAAANKITHLDGFTLTEGKNTLLVECIYEHDNGQQQIVSGTVGLRS